MNSFMFYSFIFLCQRQVMGQKMLAFDSISNTSLLCLLRVIKAVLPSLEVSALLPVTESGFMRRVKKTGFRDQTS